MAAWQENTASAAREKAAAAARLEKAHASWDDAITVIDEARKKQIAAPGLQEPAKKALATLDREWDGLRAHRELPDGIAGQLSRCCGYADVRGSRRSRRWSGRCPCRIVRHN